MINNGKVKKHQRFFCLMKNFLAMYVAIAHVLYNIIKDQKEHDIGDKEDEATGSYIQYVQMRVHHHPNDSSANTKLVNR